MEKRRRSPEDGDMADWDPFVNEIFLMAIEAGSPADRDAVLDRS
jgi:hypothetical protein